MVKHATLDLGVEPHVECRGYLKKIIKSVKKYCQEGMYQGSRDGEQVTGCLCRDAVPGGHLESGVLACSPRTLWARRGAAAGSGKESSAQVECPKVTRLPQCSPPEANQDRGLFVSFWEVGGAAAWGCGPCGRDPPLHPCSRSTRDPGGLHACSGVLRPQLVGGALSSRHVCTGAWGSTSRWVGTDAPQWGVRAVGRGSQSSLGTEVPKGNVGEDSPAGDQEGWGQGRPRWRVSGKLLLPEAAVLQLRFQRATTYPLDPPTWTKHRGPLPPGRSPGRKAGNCCLSPAASSGEDEAAGEPSLAASGPSAPGEPDPPPPRQAHGSDAHYPVVWGHGLEGVLGGTGICQELPEARAPVVGSSSRVPPPGRPGR